MPENNVTTKPIERPLQEASAFDPGCRPVRSKDEWDALTAKLSRRYDAWQVAIGVKMCHVEPGGVATHEAGETDRRKELPMVGQAIGQVRKDVRGHARRCVAVIPRS